MTISPKSSDNIHSGNRPKPLATQHIQSLIISQASVAKLKLFSTDIHSKKQKSTQLHCQACTHETLGYVRAHNHSECARCFKMASVKCAFYSFLRLAFF